MMRTVLVAALIAMLQPVTQAHAAQLWPGVVVDRRHQSAYLMHPGRTVEAVALKDGSTVWRSDVRGLPLTVWRDLLIVQQEPAAPSQSMKLAGLELESGRRKTEAAVALPEGVQATIADSQESRFRAEALSHEDDVYVEWTYARVPLRGIYEEPDTGELSPSSFQQPIRRAFRFSPSSGEAVQIDPDSMPADSPEREPARQPAANERLSADGAHVLRSEPVADNRTWDRYSWTILDRDGKKVIGRIRSHLAQAPFIVDGERILFITGPYARNVDGRTVEHPLSLRAVDLGSGRQLWTAEIFDTTFRGPFPP